MTDQVDSLYEVKTAYYIGAFQQCIQKASKVKVDNSNDLKLERDCYVYRSYVAQRKFGVVFDEIADNSGTNFALRSIRFYAKFLQNLSDSSEALKCAISSFDKEIFPFLETNHPLAWLPNVLLASCHYHCEDIDSALRTLSGAACESLEIRALTIQCYLALDRVDLTKKELKKMQDMDEDATITQLASAWCSLVGDGDKIQDAYYTFQDMADKSKATGLLLNGMASAYLRQSKQDEADGTIAEAMGIDDNCPETLINAIKNRHLAGKGIDSGSRFLSELKSNHSNHPWMRDYAAKEADFNRLAEQYANR